MLSQTYRYHAHAQVRHRGVTPPAARVNIADENHSRLDNCTARVIPRWSAWVPPNNKSGKLGLVLARWFKKSMKRCPAIQDAHNHNTATIGLFLTNDMKAKKVCRRNSHQPLGRNRQLMSAWSKRQKDQTKPMAATASRVGSDRSL